MNKVKEAEIMSALILRNHSHNNITIVENDFIDHYMVSANGEYVKVYLLLLRYQNIPEQLPDIPQMADLLENTEGDILRALKYWEKEGILSLEYDETNELAGICIGKAPTHQTPVKAAFHTPSAQSASVHEKSPVAQSDGNTTVSDKAAGQNLPASRRSLAARRELKQILFIAEQYLGKTLSRTDVDAITYFYDSLGFSADLIEYLIEYCVENGHKSMHYIQKVALSWADEHITTVDQARNSSAFYNKTCYSILNAFGIKGRGPASAELDYIRKWLEDGNFELDLILEACNRTISAIHQPSFEYTDKILENWKTGNVRTLADVERLDSAFEQEKDRRKTPSGQNRTPSAQQPSKFRNFEERSYNMDELTKELLRSN